MDPVEDTSLRVCVASQLGQHFSWAGGIFHLNQYLLQSVPASYKTVIGANGYHGRDRYGMANLRRRAYMGQRSPSVFA